MSTIFETFKPKNSTIKKYVDYYYLDIKPNNSTSNFQCFPHYNNTISLYKPNIQLEVNEILFKANKNSLQIFTPIREKILSVKQKGKVYRVVIVFHPLGIQQFYKDLSFDKFISDFDFFNQNELEEIFSTTDTIQITQLLDNFLEEKFEKFEHPLLEKTLEYIFNNYDDFKVEELSKNVNISRQHLNKVFKSHFGLSIKSYHKIVLFRKTIHQKLFETPDDNFTKVAHQFNYNDQSHFIKIYKALTGNSPKSFFSKGTLLGNEDTFWHL